MNIPLLQPARLVSCSQNPMSKPVIAGYWTTAFGCAGKLPGGVGGGPAVRDGGRCVELAQNAAAAIEAMVGPAAETCRPSQGGDEGGSGVGDSPRIGSAVLASVDASGSKSIAKRHP